MLNYRVGLQDGKILQNLGICFTELGGCDKMQRQPSETDEINVTL